MIVASKLEEYYPIEISKMLHLTENSYRKEEVLRMERIILELVGFKVMFFPSLILNNFSRFSYPVHHAKPPGVLAEVHPSGPQVGGGPVLLKLHLPP